MGLKINKDRTITMGVDVIGTISHVPIGSDDAVRKISLNSGLQHATILAELCYYPVRTAGTQHGLSYICVRTDRIAKDFDRLMQFEETVHAQRLNVHLGNYLVGSLSIDADGFMDIDTCDLLKPVVRKNIYRALAVANEYNHCYIVAAILQRELQRAAVNPVVIDLDIDDLVRVDNVHSADECYVSAYILAEFNAATFPVVRPEYGVLWISYRKNMMCYIDGVFYRMTMVGASKECVSLSELVKQASDQFCAGLKITAHSRDGRSMMSATELRIDINGIPSAFFSKGPKKRTSHMLSAATRLPMPALIKPLIHTACFQWK